MAPQSSCRLQTSFKAWLLKGYEAIEIPSEGANTLQTGGLSTGLFRIYSKAAAKEDEDLEPFSQHTNRAESCQRVMCSLLDVEEVGLCQIVLVPQNPCANDRFPSGMCLEALSVFKARKEIESFLTGSDAHVILLYIIQVWHISSTWKRLQTTYSNRCKPLDTIYGHAVCAYLGLMLTNVSYRRLNEDCAHILY